LGNGTNRIIDGFAVLSTAMWEIIFAIIRLHRLNCSAQLKTRGGSGADELRTMMSEFG